MNEKTNPRLYGLLQTLGQVTDICTVLFYDSLSVICLITITSSIKYKCKY